MALVTTMASSGLSVPFRLSPRFGLSIKGLPTLPPNRARVRVASALQKMSARAAHPEGEISIAGSSLAAALFASLAASDSAVAGQQVADLAAADNRGAAILIPMIPALGWVTYNILQPALNQFNMMKSVKGMAVGIGVGAVASCVIASQASAIQEITDIAADNDSRGILVLLVLLPAIGWVLFNILKPALNQLDRMNSSKSVIGGLGLGATSMLFAPHADATEELASLAADSDSRGLLVLFVLLPAIGWVLFNILQPALKQFDKMRSGK